MQSSPSALGFSPDSETVGDVRPIQFPRSKRGVTSISHVAEILSVGVDLSFYRSESQVWKSDGCHVTRQVWYSAGYNVTPSGSALKAFEQLRKGDFDLVLVGDAVPVCERERLTTLVRALGLHVPIVCVTDCCSDFAAFADATVRKEPMSVLQCIGDLLAKRSGNAVMKHKPFQFDSVPVA